MTSPEERLVQLGLFGHDTPLAKSPVRGDETYPELPAGSSGERAGHELADGAIGYVSSEGGPLLIVDLVSAGAWHGAEGNDYAAAIESIEDPDHWAGSVLPVGPTSGFLWDSSPGTTDVWCEEDGDEVLLSRAVVDDEADIEPLAKASWSSPTTHGTITIVSGWLVVLWAPESGEGLLADSAHHGRALDLAVGSAGLIVRCRPGRYLIETDEVSRSSAFAARCRFRRLE